ncbi:MAG: DUF2849 domain-containing protein [Sandaracinaceae bacterium]|nr:DUF2849 domain-containing protein [Sandaracinaceae bacterium]
MPKLIVTAQRLSDGRVVYLRRDRSWAQRDAEAFVSEDAALVEALVDWAKTQTEAVVEPYRVEVEVESGVIRHLTARERIRAEGPSAVLRRFGPVRSEPARVAVG